MNFFISTKQKILSNGITHLQIQIKSILKYNIQNKTIKI